MAKKVLVVDDSLFMRNMITRCVEEDSQLQVAGTARNGAEAVLMAKNLKPDVITMDIEMPVMNGLEALDRIMTECPTPVVMLSSLTQEGARETVRALQMGAVDFIPKPSGASNLDLSEVKEEMLTKIKIAALTSPQVLKMIRRRPREDREFPVQEKPPAGPGVPGESLKQIVAIGTSTGGPRALDAVIGSLPADFPYPVLVVQHMPSKFTKSLADRLDARSQVQVVEAAEGEAIRGGTVYIAPGGFHMTAVLENGTYRIRLHQEDPRKGHRPSVDVLFESVSRLSELRRHFVLMTGMGSDGARGMLLAKESGAATTIAESAESCIVFGMPRAAIELGCVDHVVPLESISKQIAEAVRTKPSS